MPLAPAYESQAVQAFPISFLTKRGTLSNEDCRNRSVLHIVDDCTVIFTLQDDSTLSLDVLAGQDFGLTRDVKSLTSTSEVVIG